MWICYESQKNCRTLLHMQIRTCMCGALCDLLALHLHTRTKVASCIDGHRQFILGDPEDGRAHFRKAVRRSPFRLCMSTYRLGLNLYAGRTSSRVLCWRDMMVPFK